MEQGELGLIEGFLLCLWDPEEAQRQSSRWKRSLLVFSSGVCLEIAALPLAGSLLRYETHWPLWLLTWLFASLGLSGLYVSKFGDDRWVEWLLIGARQPSGKGMKAKGYKRHRDMKQNSKW